MRAESRKPYTFPDTPERACRECGTLFKPHSPRNNICTPECYVQRNVRMSRERARKRLAIKPSRWRK